MVGRIKENTKEFLGLKKFRERMKCYKGISVDRSTAFDLRYK